MDDFQQVGQPPHLAILFGFPLILAALAGGLLLYWIIDPKLRAVSADYESKQATYLEELERSVRWNEGALDAGPEG